MRRRAPGHSGTIVWPCAVGVWVGILWEILGIWRTILGVPWVPYKSWTTLGWNLWLLFKISIFVRLRSNEHYQARELFQSRTYQPLDKFWEVNPPLKWRWNPLDGCWKPSSSRFLDHLPIGKTHAFPHPFYWFLEAKKYPLPKRFHSPPRLTPTVATVGAAPGRLLLPRLGFHHVFTEQKCASQCGFGPENVGLIFPMIYSHFSWRDNDQPNHWVQWATQHFQTHPCDL